jgi:Ca-activated chloride channel homolog
MRAATGGEALTIICGVLSWILQILLVLPSLGSAACVPPMLHEVTRSIPDGFFHKDQEPARGGFSLKVNVDLVTVDAIVRDRQGAIVDGLRVEDFALYDDGIAQKVTHFSRDQLPLAVALLVDRSPSIANYLAEFRNTAWSALERLKPGDQVALFSFDERPSRLTDLTEDRPQIAARVGEIAMGLNTNVYDALVESARYLHAQAPERRRAIIMISDNYTDLLHYDDKDALREVLEASATLFSIKAPSEFHWAPPLRDPKLIEQIARATGGQVLNLSAAQTLGGALDNAIADLRQGYTLGFTPSRSGKEASFHRLTVKLVTGKRCSGCTVQARSGYYFRVRALYDRPGSDHAN